MLFILIHSIPLDSTGHSTGRLSHATPAHQPGFTPFHAPRRRPMRQR
jgi:hypothetical protein